MPRDLPARLGGKKMGQREREEKGADGAKPSILVLLLQGGQGPRERKVKVADNKEESATHILTFCYSTMHWIQI